MMGGDPGIKKRINYLSCVEGKGAGKTFTVFYNWYSIMIILLQYLAIARHFYLIILKENLFLALINSFKVCQSFWCEVY